MQIRRLVAHNLLQSLLNCLIYSVYNIIDLSNFYVNFLNMLPYLISLHDHLLQQLILDLVRVLLDDLYQPSLVLINLIVLNFIVLENLLLVFSIDRLQILQKLKISLSRLDQRLALDAEPLGRLVRRENIHGEHLWLLHKYVFVFWQAIQGGNLLDLPAVGALNTHHALAVRHLPQLIEAILTKRMAALQNSRHLELFVERIRADLAIHLVRLVKLLIKDVDPLNLRLTLLYHALVRALTLQLGRRALQFLVLDVHDRLFQVQKALTLLADITLLQLDILFILLLVHELLLFPLLLLPPLVPRGHRRVLLLLSVHSILAIYCYYIYTKLQ